MFIFQGKITAILFLHKSISTSLTFTHTEWCVDAKNHFIWSINYWPSCTRIISVDPSRGVVSLLVAVAVIPFAILRINNWYGTVSSSCSSQVEICQCWYKDTGHEIGNRLLSPWYGWIECHRWFWSHLMIIYHHPRRRRRRRMPMHVPAAPRRLRAAYL